MKNNEQFTEIIYSLFASIIQNTGVSLASPGQLEALRQSSSKLSSMIEDRIAAHSVLLVKLLQDAVDEGFKSLEAEVEALKAKVKSLESSITPAVHRP